MALTGSSNAHVVIVVLTSFFASLTLAYVLIRLVGAKFPVSSFFDKWAGGALAAVHAMAIGFFILWGLNFSVVSSQKKFNLSILDNYYQSPAVKMAGKLVGGVTRWTLQILGVSELKAQVAGAFAQQPDYVILTLQDVSASSSTKAFIADAKAQHLMNEADVEGLMALPAYRAFAHQPAIEQFISVMEPVGIADTDGALAETVTHVWLVASSFRDDPEVQEILKDPDVQRVLKQNNPGALLANPKLKPLLSKILDKLEALTDFESIATLSTLEKGVFGKAKPEPEER